MRSMIDGAQSLLREFDIREDRPHRPLELTALGTRVLAGEAYWLDCASAGRWVGGIRIEPGHAHWTLDEALLPKWRHSLPTDMPDKPCADLEAQQADDLPYVVVMHLARNQAAREWPNLAIPYRLEADQTGKDE